jgi:hypothetical protein
MNDPIGEYRAWLQMHGPAGLAFLNARVPHRYSAIYKLSGGKLHNLYLHDKLGEVTPEFLQVVPFEDSFCQFVLRDGVFVTENSAADKRLDGHKYQGVMVTYHGVPLLDNRSDLFGTLCHFDVVGYGLPASELDFLQRVARELPAYLPAN